MKLVGKFIIQIISNIVAIIGTAYVIPTFFSGNSGELIAAAFILALINTFLKPIIRFLSSPFILLTFGLFTIVINAASIYILDIASQAVTIQGIDELIITTLIIGAVNFVTALAAKMGYHK